MLAHLILAALFFVPRPTAEAPFSDLNFEQALAAAKKDGKVVMIDFFTTWCPPCKKLDKTTWPDPEVQKWLAEKVVALKMDAEKEVELAKKYGIVSYPTMLFVKPDGKELGRITAYKTPAEFLSEANDTLAGKDSVARAKEKLAGHENDPSARQRYAQALAETGKHEEALAEYLWCFDHGNDDPNQGYAGVRLSFLLGDIARLGKQYPAAIQALEARRDKAESVLLSGKGTRDDASALCALNKNLGAPEKTLAAYDRLQKENLLGDAVRERMLTEVAGLLVEAKRYSELVQYGGDVEKRVDREIENYNATARLPPGRDPDERKAMEKTMAVLQADRVSKLSVWYEALLGAGQQDRAGAVAEKLIGFAPSGSTYVTLIERAVHAGADGAARALADRGRKSLSDAEKAELEIAAKRIPAGK